ncbi:hypothetical protein CBR_g68444 [Chara braunii]|uniref:Uncharacterized protein n=1 Tax=Chara braunii TaxID=69332 RepID=A0A388MFS3_CHABU|nr:hypothetical protein CBR_g68444 [Chara braunii]|eukprot:GBG93400.1 hypothetical protein CBR_g68444 [Chara braunii]
MQRCLMEITWGLEEGSSPHLEVSIDLPRLRGLMQCYYMELEEGQALCAELEDLCCEDDDDIEDGVQGIDPIADDATKTDINNHNDLAYTTTTTTTNNNNNHNNNNDNDRTVITMLTTAQTTDIDINDYTDNEKTVHDGGMEGGVPRSCALGRSTYNNSDSKRNDAVGVNNNNNNNNDDT